MQAYSENTKHISEQNRITLSEEMYQALSNNNSKANKAKSIVTKADDDAQEMPNTDDNEDVTEEPQNSEQSIAKAEKGDPTSMDTAVEAN